MLSMSLPANLIILYDGYCLFKMRFLSQKPGGPGVRQERAGMCKLPTMTVGDAKADKDRILRRAGSVESAQLEAITNDLVCAKRHGSGDRKATSKKQILRGDVGVALLGGAGWSGFEMSWNYRLCCDGTTVFVVSLLAQFHGLTVVKFGREW